MKHTSLLTLCLAVATFGVRAEDKPLLAVPGKVIYESKLDAAPGATWKAAKGKWELMEGVMRGSELEADKHGAVTRLPSSSTTPALGASSPAIRRSSVDLPQPDGPTTATNSPSRSVMSTASRACVTTAPRRNDFATPATDT